MSSSAPASAFNVKPKPRRAKSFLITTKKHKTNGNIGPPEGPPEPTRGPTRGAPRPTRRAQVGGPTWGPSGWAILGPSGWAQAGPKWVGPSWAQARNLGPPKQILEIKIHVAQNVGKVWMSRKKILLAPFGPIWAHFLRGPEKNKKSVFLQFS